MRPPALAHRTMLATLLVGVLVGTAPAQDFAIGAEVAPTYRQGDSGQASFNVTLDDAGQVDAAVIYLNVVRLAADGSTPQAAHLIFDDASVEGDIFQRVLSGEELAGGLGATLRFRLREDARPDRYAVVIQVFQGHNTNPHRVRLENRLAIGTFDFELTDADAD